MYRPGARSSGKMLGTLEVTLGVCPSATRHVDAAHHEYRIYDTRDLWNCNEYCTNLSLICRLCCLEHVSFSPWYVLCPSSIDSNNTLMHVLAPTPPESTQVDSGWNSETAVNLQVVVI